MSDEWPVMSEENMIPSTRKKPGSYRDLIVGRRLNALRRKLEALNR